MPYDNAESQVVKRVGKWYLEQPEASDIEDTAVIEKAYQEIARINRRKYEQIPIPVMFVERDPYESYAEMKAQVEQTDILKVYNGGSKPAYMSKSNNLIGRAVHDYFGHLDRDCNFSMRGEWQKFNHVKDDYPPLCRNLLFTEIVGQRACIGYLDNAFESERYVQKPVFAPNSLIEWANDKLSE